MPQRKVALVAGQYYHIYNRGNNREPIFFEAENYLFFLRQLRTYVAGEHAAIIAYALLPNHYHMIIQALSDQLSLAMMRLGVSYTKAINKRTGRTGRLFEHEFQAKLIERDEYLTHLSRYIHLNPVHAGLAQRAEDWPYSSYPDYLGSCKGTLPRTDVVLSQFPSISVYREFVESYDDAQRPVIAALLF